MSQEPELEQWRAAWTSAAPIQALRSREHRLRITYVLNLLFAAGLFAFAAWVLRTRWSLEALAWASVVWLTTAGATAFHVWNWRTLWNTSGQAVLDYTASQQRQCHAMLRAVRFGYAFLALQDAISIPWLTWDFRQGSLPLGSYLASLLIIAALTMGFVAWFIRSRRHALRQLTQIAEYQRSLVAE